MSFTLIFGLVGGFIVLIALFGDRKGDKYHRACVNYLKRNAKAGM